MGLAANKLNGTVNTGSEIDDYYNALIDAILTAFDIDGSGIATFTVTPKCANTPTVDNHLTRKKYVDDAIAAIPPFGGQMGAYASKSKDTVYQAATDGEIKAYNYPYNSSLSIIIYTDANNPPTTIRDEQTGNAAGGGCGPSVSAWVRKGEYYKVGGTATPTAIWWVPLGS